MSYTTLPLHPAQLDVFTDQLINSESPKYNIGGYIRLKGFLNKDKFHEAINSAPDVFDAFKMSFDLEDQEPCCYYNEEYTKAELKEFDFSSRNNPGNEAKDWMKDQLNTPFQIRKNNHLVENSLLRIAADEHLYFMKFHHLITDGYGFIVWIQYVSRKYTSLIDNNNTEFNYPQYREEVLKATQYRNTSNYELDGKYWKDKISAKPEKLLQRKYSNFNGSVTKSATHILTINKDQQKLLEKIQFLTKSGLQQLTIAAMLIYLGKTSGQEEFIFGIPVHKRGSKRLRNIVGMFSGILPYKGTFHESATIEELLKDISSSQKRDYRHHSYLIGDLSRHLKVNSSEGYLSEISVDYEPFRFELFFGKDIEAAIFRLENEYERNALQLCWQDYGNEQPLQLHIYYGNEYFSKEEIKLLAERILFILEQFPEDLNKNIGSIKILSSQEEELLRDFGSSSVEYAVGRTIVEIIEDQATRMGGAIALVCEGEELTYKELNERSNRLGHYLRKRGVGEETLVPVCIERSIGMVVGIVGILKAGGAYVPIDPGYPRERIEYMVSDTGAAVVVSSAEGRINVGAREGVEIIEIDGDWGQISDEAADNTERSVGSGNLVYVIYTSGSTGRPKGVMIEHGSLLDHCYGVIKSAGLEGCGSFALFSPLVFDAGHSIIHSCFIVGGSLHILGKELILQGDRLREYVDNNEIDCIKIVPSLWLSYADGGDTILSKKVMIFGGEAFSGSIGDHLVRSGYNGEVYNHYGPTEATIGKSIYKIDINRRYVSVPIGKPFSNTRIYIVNSVGELVPAGVAGEIWIGGEGVARGYLNQGELTEEKFILDVFSKEDGGRIYKTGDLGYWLSDGNIEYLGRKDEQVKIRGYRIEVGEIESVLMQSELVSQAVVCAGEDREGNKRLVGYVVAKEDFRVEGVTEYLRGKLPEYMIPMLWVEIERVPLTSNGKVDRKALPEVAVSALSEKEYTVPRTEMEEKLAGIWQKLLGIEKIGVHDNFFDLGGHSLMASRIVSSVRKILEVEMVIKDLFVYSTIARLAAYIQVQHKGLSVPSVSAQERPDLIPLSFSQERLWFIDQLEGSVQYHIPAVLRLEGELNRNALERSFKEIINRHEVLRTVICEQDGQGYQYVNEQGGWKLSIVDGSLYKDDTSGLREYIDQLNNRPFDLSKDYMLRAALIKLEDEEHILVVTMHHIASDAWSIYILVTELVKLYNYHDKGLSSQLPFLGIQYTDYAIWQRRYLSAEVLDRKISYWKEKLSEVSPLHLAADYVRPAVQSTRGAILAFNIDKDVSEGLQMLNRDHGTTLFMTLLAVFKVLLYRYSSQEDICVGTSIATRQHEAEGLIGFFVNTLALRDRVEGSGSFTELLQQVKTTTLEAYEHQEVPFEKVVETVVKERDPGRSPLFQVMLVLQNTPMLTEFNMGKMCVTREEVEYNTSKFDLTFFIAAGDNGLQGAVQYRTGLFREDTMEAMTAHYVELLRSVVRQPYQKIGLLPMLGVDEERNLLDKFNTVTSVYLDDRSVVDLFEEQVLRVPNKLALVFGQEEVNYLELNKRSNQLAHYLRSKGIKEDMLVPLCIERGILMVVAIVGILKAGGAYVPVDTEFPSERISYMVEETQASVVVSSRMSSEKVMVREGILVIEIDGDLAIISQPEDNVGIPVKAHQLAYVIYTSGSTGRPKGVMIEHGSLVDYVYGLKQCLRIDQCVSYALVSTIATDLGNTVLYSSLVFGGMLHLFSKDAVNDVSLLHNYFRDYGIDCLKIVPSHWKALCMDSELLLPEKLLIFGGEALQSDMVENIVLRSNGCRIVNHYGPTETTIGKLLHEVERGRSYGSTIPIGKPFSNTEVYVLTKELSLCPVGVAGQLYIGGAGVSRGYVNNEVLTREKFIKNPYKKAEGGMLYCTGDLVRYGRGGDIEFIGRADEQVKIRGYRIELGEIESVLLQSELVREAVVLAREDKEGGKRLVSYIVEEGEYNREEIIRYTRERLPEYMVPGVWVKLEAMPLTANGKIDRKSLPDPDISVDLSKQYAEGRNEAESKLVLMWEELLEVERIGIHDDFFELGGHSLLAIRLISLIRKELEAEVKISDVFDYPTIGLLSEHLKGGSGEAMLSSIVIQARPERIPLSFSQERLWFIDQLEGSVQYHLPAVLRLKGELNEKALGSAFKEIVNRHEVLRTVIREHDGIQYQYVKEKDGWELSIVDGSIYKGDELGLQEYIQQLNNTPFNLSQDYMLRAKLIILEDREYLLVVTMHHIASDAWSTHILVTELVKLYSYYDRGLSSDLAPLVIQYADYAIWQRRHMPVEVFEKKAGYWKEKLEGVGLLQLPVDFARSSVQSTRGSVSVFRIDKGVSEGLELLCHQQGVTLFMTLLSAFKVLLYRYSGQQDICVGTSVANRTQHEVEGLIGFFVNTLALRDEVKGGVSFTELLQQVKRTTLEAYEHQEVPFEKVVEVSVKERDPGRSPLFQVMFVLRNTPEVPDLRFGELNLLNEGYAHNKSKFDLTFFVSETVDGLQGSVQYRTDLFSSERIGRMTGHFAELLGSVVREPDQRVGLLPMLRVEEERELLVDFNDTKVLYPVEETIIGLFEDQVVKVPGAVAVVFEGEKITYKELNERSNQLGHYLRSKGVRSGTLVPVCIERSIEMVVGIVGILKAGGGYVPIDPGYPRERIEYMVADTGASVVVSSKESSACLLDLEGAEVIEADAEWSMLHLQSVMNVDAGVRPEDLAYVIYTSGSTGKPKGVMVEHGSLVDYVYGLKEKIQIEESRSYALVSTIATDLGNTVIYSSLVFGGALHVFSKEAVNDVRVLHSYFREYGIDCLKIVPSHWKALCMDSELLLPEKLLIFGGEALQTELAENIRLRGNGCRIVNHYGPTETTIGKLLHEVKEGTRYGSTIPVGKPFSNTVVYVLTKELSLCPVGVGGQLYIGGAGVARGYVNNKELTDLKFIEDPFNRGSGGRLYGTGDLVRYREDGNIEFIGRADEQVKIRGYRIELGEIESMLLQSELVREAVVLAREDKEGGKSLVGYVVGEGGFDREGIVSYLRVRLPEYMIPGIWVELEAMPLTANGKIDRKSLPDADGGDRVSKEYAGGRDEAERKLAGIWEELLEVERVGIHDDFFELGGHSLLAIRLISLIRKELGVEVKISDVFDYPTIGLLSEHLKGGSGEAMLSSIVIQARPERIPLSFSQERLWFIDQLEGSVQYHIPSVLRLKGKLDVGSLSASLQSIVDRHEVLRTVILQQEGEPYQYVKEKGGWRLGMLDGSEYGGDELGLQECIYGLINKGFDLSEDDLFRADLVGVKEGEHVLVVTFHHIVSDGWSTSVFVRELVELYRSKVAGGVAELSVLAVQYADYSIWQRRYLQGELWERKMGYWKGKLEGVGALQLPTDYRRPVVQSTRGSVERFSIEKEVSEGLQVLSREQGVTMFMMLVSIFKVLLYRYSGQQDICIGTPIAGRQHQELEGLIGFFVNTLALRDRVEGSAGFRELVQKVKETTLEAYEHQEVPFERVVEAVVKERDLSRSPLFQVMFVLQNTPEVPRLELGEVELSREVFVQTTSKFDLSFNLTETGGGLKGSVQYCTDLYSKETIDRMIGHFIQLSGGVIKDPDQKIGSLPMLGKEEERQLLEEFNDTRAEYPKDKTVVDLFEEQVERTPEAVAVVFDQEQLSYGELNERSNRLAHYLREKGVKAETLVPVCIERGIEMVVGILGILKAGGGYVPIDTEYPEERIEYMLKDTGAAVVVSSKKSRVKLRDAESILIIEIDGEIEEFTEQSSENLNTVIASSQLAYVIYTSGSTGKPKGVMIEHGSLLNYLLNSKAGYVADGSSNAGSFIHLSYTFDASLTGMFMPLLSGKSIIVGSKQGVEVFEDSNLWKYAPYDFIKITPSHLELLQGVIRDSGGKLLTDKLVIGGEALQSGHFSYFVDKGIDVEVINEYGPTEATVGCSTYCFRTIGDYEKIKKGIPVGKPIDNVVIYVLGESDELVPVGVAGEICIGGAGVARGYLNRSALTLEKFTEDSYSKESGTRMYRTGDIGRWLGDGNIEYMGRKDDQVKIRGYRIELGEIESVVLQSGLVSQAVVVAREDKEGGKQLTGYVVADEGFEVEALKVYLKEKLPEYMVPVLWVKLKEFPLTVNGKIDRKGLPDADTGELLSKEYEAPRNEIEEKLAAIWQRLLNVDRVGIHDNFFDLGGHSLMATRIVSAIRRELEVEVVIKDLFIYPTIGELCGYLGGQVKGLVMPSIGLQARPDRIPLSFSQERLWFIDQLEGSVQYHIPSVLRLKGKLDVGSLSASLQSIVDRHEVLRTVILQQEGEPYQYVKEKGGWRLGMLDGSEYGGDELGLQECIYGLINKGFDLSEDDLFRADLVGVKEGEHVLVVTFHHIVSDGWSTSVFVRELVELYRSKVAGGVAELSVLAVQYADYSIWQRRYLQGELWERKMGYWKGKLEGVGALQLPTDYRRPVVQSTRGSVERFSIEKEVSEGLQVLSREQGVTMFMMLVSIFKVLLYRYSGQQDICIGTPIAGRQHQELEGLIGFFVNTLALRDRVEGSAGFRELVQKVKETTLEAYEHQEVPFERVVEAVVKERDLSRSPLFQVMFVLQNTPEVPRLELGEVELSREVFVQTTSKFDLSFNLTETGGGLKGSVQYCTDLYSKETIDRMIGHFIQLSGGVIKEPDQKIGSLPMLGKEEERQLLEEFNDTRAEYPKDKTVVDLFEEQVERTPEAAAVVFDQEQLSYGELNERSNRLAHYLREKGVKAETLVPVCIERGIEMVVGILGILKAGGGYVPIDTEYPEERIEYMLKDTGAAVVVSSKKSRVKLRDAESIFIIEIDGEIEELTEQSSENLNTVIASSQLAYVIYTSGSTGKPKGVMIEHGSLLNYLLNSKAGYVGDGSSNAGSFIHLSYTFDASLTGMFMPLLSGKSIIVGSKQGVEVFEDSNLWKYAPYDFIKITPSHLELLQGVIRDSGGKLLTDKLVIGGEALRSGHFSYFVDKGIDVEVINEYGPTEATVGCSTYCFRTIGDYEKIKKGIPVGKPIDNVVIYVLGESDELVPVGVAGEICIGGAGVARGYLNRAELTSEKFTEDPYSKESGTRMYRTGDIGRWLGDGNIEYMGRKDDQVKIRGYRIELGEIESVVLQSGLVSQAAVVAREDKEGNKRLAGYVVLEEGSELEAVKVYLRGKLPEYMVPVLWVKLKEFPLTVNGKIDRKGLPAADESELSGKEYEAPRNEIEEKLAAIWQELLHVDRVGIHDNFFELGGDSIITIQVTSRFKRLGYTIQPKDIFIHQTIGNLSRVVAEHSEEVIPAEQGQLQGYSGLLPIQQWYFEKGAVAGSYFNQSVLLRIDKAITERVLDTAVKKLVSHHDALRYKYYKKDDKWQQVYWNSKGGVIKEDMRSESQHSIGNLISKCAESHQRNLNIANGELIRVIWMQTPATENENRLLIVIHHLAIDGVSWRILLEDAEALINALTNGQNISLGRKSSSYRQWYEALEQYGQSYTLQSQKGYWQKVVKICESLNVDFNYNGTVKVKETGYFSVKLGAEKTRELIQEIPRVYHTEINDLLLAALAKTICEWNNTNKVIIGLEGHGREDISERIDTSRTVGWFTSLYPVLIDIGSNTKEDDLIKGVKEQLRRIPDKGLGYGVLKYINKEESLQGEECWDIVFNYLGQLDNVVRENRWIKGTGESSGAGTGEEFAVSEKLSVNSLVRAGELILNWRYSTKHFYEQTARKIAENYIYNLEVLIAYCLKRHISGQIEYTPSDYGLGADVSYQELDRFLELEEDNIDNIMSF